MLSLVTWLVAAAPGALLLPAGAPDANRNPRQLGQFAFAYAIAALIAGLLALAAVFISGPMTVTLFEFSGAGASLYLDALSTAMFALVAFIGATIIRYSLNYLDGDPNQGRFLKLLSATIAAVMTVVISGNLALLILAWVATSLLLNRLLLFYPNRQPALLAARKKFVVSRLSDLCLLGAAGILYAHFQTLDIREILSLVQTLDAGQATWVAVLLAGAAIFSAAQFPFHGWILEVMETPTPVSALLHAGIINAGGFLIIRFSEVIAAAPAAMLVLLLVGGVTALFGSLVMLTQTSVKVSLAYSTIAQMGFMLMQCGLGAFAGAFLHIIAHSLYKAHAFLSSGSVIDLLRASWSPSPSGKPHPGRFTLALAGVLSIAALTGWVFGATIMEKPGAVVLGLIFLMGLTLLLASAIDERRNLRLLISAIGAATGVSALYFLLQRASELMLHGAIAETQAVQNPLQMAAIVLIVLSFAAVTWLQSQLGWANAYRNGRALYVHLSQGLYVNTLCNRWALRFWPSRKSSPQS
jgi:NAD(P)H-quinone oxidoreductase subunit 5